MSVKVATRGSKLALWQAHRVIELLGIECELIVVKVEGEKHPDTPISAMGGTGVFVKEVQDAVLSGVADIAVHSAKDLPSETVGGLVLGAVPERSDPRDVLVGRRLADLPVGAIVATGAIRRRAQLLALRPDLQFAELRGNVDTRLSKVGDYDAIVLAAAGVLRLGRGEEITEVLEPSTMVPQVGQGTLAVQCRADDFGVLALLSGIDNASTRSALEAERAYLLMMGGDCDLPVGALATAGVDGSLAVDALLASVDGSTLLTVHEEGDTSDPFALGERAAKVLLDERGGRDLL